MLRKNNLVFLAVLILFVLAALVVFPIEEGWFGKLNGVRLGLDLQGGTRLVYKADLSSVVPGTEDEAVEEAGLVLENRITPLGVSETSARRMGEDAILVEVPGRSLTDKEKESLGSVALLEFAELVSEDETFKWENALGKWKPATAAINRVEKELTSRSFNENAYVDQNSVTGEILL